MASRMGKKAAPIDPKKRRTLLFLGILSSGLLTLFLLLEWTKAMQRPSNEIEQQQQQQPQPIKHHFLGAVIFNRVFKEDLFNITGRECRQWVEYMLYAGVDRIYWYDTAHSDSESQESSLRDYVKSGKVTYHRFYHLFPTVEGSDFHYEQDNSYKHFISNYNATMDWVLEMDVDEYPFSSVDTKSGFLVRFLRAREREVSQVLVQCMIFAGNPRGESSQKLMIERYTRRNARTEGRTAGFGSRQKPIFKPDLSFGVTNFDPHSFRMREGTTLVSEVETLRMNHYWGPRETNFGPDTPAVLQRLVEDESIIPIALELKRIPGLLKS